MYLSIHLYLDSCLFKIADAPLSTSVEFRREIRKWAPVTRAFEWRPTDRRFLRKLPQDAGARNGEGVATLIFVLFSVFFLIPSPSVLRRSEKRKGRNTASWSPPPPRRFWKEGLSQNTSTCSCAWTLLLRICMPACHLRRRLVSCSLTRSQLIPGTSLSTFFFVPKLWINRNIQKDLIRI